MVLNAEKHERLFEVLALRDDTAAGAGASTPAAPPTTQIVSAPAPSASLDVVPLAAVGASSTPAPLDVVPLVAVGASSALALLKRVVEIVSDDEVDTTDDLVFKKRRVAVATVSNSSSARRLALLIDHPPSASSPQSLFTLEGGGESVPELVPKFPLVLQQILKGYQKGAMGSSNNKAVRENLALSVGEFLAQADAFSHEAESKAKEQLALAKELALVKE